MAVRDFEVIMDEVADIFKTNIDDCVTEINSQKGDSLLTSFDPAKDYFLYRLPSRTTLPNRKVFFLQGVENPNPISIEGSTALNYRIAIDVFVVLTGDEKGDRKILRYMRIIKYIIEKKIAAKLGHKSIEIDAVQLLNAEDAQTSNLYLYGTTIFGLNLA